MAAPAAYTYSSFAMFVPGCAETSVGAALRGYGVASAVPEPSGYALLPAGAGLPGYTAGRRAG